MYLITYKAAAHMLEALHPKVHVCVWTCLRWLFFSVELVSPLQVTHLPLCGIFYLPWHRHQIEGTTGF